MKKAIKKTCVVLLLFALLVSQVAASYSETGTLNEGTSAISAAERYLSNWAYNSYMYADKNLTLGTVLDAEVDPAKLTLATSEFMALRNDADGQENNISVAVSKMQANIQNAWKYAYTYATSTTTSTANSYYNTDIFNDYSGPDAGDCMNFASQAIYAGFSGSNNLTSVNAGTAPQDTVGIAAGQPNAAQTKWYAKPASTYWAWTSCGYFRDYIDYSVNDTETRLRAVKKPITASSDFSEVGTANLIGSIIHVNGSKPLGHAVIVNNATGTARNQIYFTAHSPNAKNLNLAEEYSGQMVSIRPTYFYDVTTCTGANTSHTFSSTNSKCARCGYVRTYIIPTLLTPMAKNTQITLTARTNHTVSSISMSVKNPNGATTNLGTVTNTTSISKVYTPTVAAHPNDLYTVTVTAVSADGVTTSSTWTFRTY